MKNLSVLDLVFLRSGQTASDAIQDSVDLACHVERLGYKRFWVAEHHDSRGISSSAPEVLIGHLAQATSRLRVGSGGIMLPNHSTLHIAEIFRTLEAIYPGRIDLGLGRAPGTDPRATAALRKGSSQKADDFPEQVVDLIQYLHDELPVKAIPIITGTPQLWILGSSEFGAQLAAAMGLPYSFAQHFSSLDAVEVMSHYKSAFRSSNLLSKPYVSMGCHVICAETDEEAEDLALSSDLSMTLFARTGQSEPLRDVESARDFGIDRETLAAVRRHFPKFVGSPGTIRRQLASYLEVADELVISTSVYDQKARHRSYELLIKELLSPSS